MLLKINQLNLFLKNARQSELENINLFDPLMQSSLLKGIYNLYELILILMSSKHLL